MKKYIEKKLAEINAEIKAYEEENPIYFPILPEYKIMAAKRELLTELLDSIKR